MSTHMKWRGGQPYISSPEDGIKEKREKNLMDSPEEWLEI